MTLWVYFPDFLASHLETPGHLLDSMFTSDMELRRILLSESIHQFQREGLQKLQNEKPSGRSYTSWDRSEKSFPHTTGSETVVPEIPCWRQYTFTCPISFWDPIYISRFYFDVEQKKYGIKLIWSEKASCGTYIKRTNPGTVDWHKWMFGRYQRRTIFQLIVTSNTELKRANGRFHSAV
jgi:hypothetical protein